MAAPLNDCGCCEGIAALIPEPLFNRLGLSEVRYRVGTHADFLRSALAALSDRRFAALRNLTTRESDDFTIALLDGWATLADVISFYQERIANEFWLRTATERDSILRLAQLIGYRLKPGVAAETPICFLLDETPGAPTEVAIKIGTKVQSVPGAEEKPQTFETIEEIQARTSWGVLKPQTSKPHQIGNGLKQLYLQGLNTRLQPGDAILMVGNARASDKNSTLWEFRRLQTVTMFPEKNYTLVTWKDVLTKFPTPLGATQVKVFALRQHAAFFGHNAPDWKSMPESFRKAYDPNPTRSEWPGFKLQNGQFDLDALYPKVVEESWMVVTKPSYVQLHKASTVTSVSRAQFAISAKITRITPDLTPAILPLRSTTVYAQSEELEMASTRLVEPATGSSAASLTRDPELLAPLEGSVITLADLIMPLAPGRKAVVTGKLLRVRASVSLTLTSVDGLQTVVPVGDSLTLTARPTLLPGNSARLTLRTDEGFEGTVTASISLLVLVSAEKDDTTISELAIVKSCAGEPTTLTLQSALVNLFDRATVTIAANVAAATHGETVMEVLGSGDASEANQSFKMKQSPLTYIRSTVPGGAKFTLQVRVNDLLWHEVPTLFQHQPREHIFTTELADDGTVTVRSGDGLCGARLPSGAQNVKATYRRGIGLAGLVRAGQLNTLLTRPPGLKSAINPIAAQGADDPESLANARQNAPVTVLTLDRVVALKDYEYFSRTYAGIAKALATWTWDGRTRGVFITVAGPLGAEVSDSLISDLITAIHAAGDPFVPVRIASYEEVLFRLSGQIKVDPDYESDKVLSATLDALRANFSFAQRDFGQPVVLSEVIALVQAVRGVVAVNIKTLYQTGNAAILNARLEADLPKGNDPNSLGAAELFTLDPAPVDLQVMS
jgi:hypothetical protein